MAINKKLIHFENFENFNSKKLSANKENTKYTIGISGEVINGTDIDILYQSIVYIKDTQQQWTHGTLYSTVNWSVLEDPFNGYEYVDLGLPSGTLWAKCNVGAEKESDYGLYFQWGDVVGYRSDQVGSEEGKKYFYWTDYKYTITSRKPEPTIQVMTKYNDEDNKTTLELSDDAASVNMGGSWRMPSNEEYEELLNNTTNTWTTVSGVNGRLFTGNNGNTLFFPASGVCQDASVGGVGSYGYCWSSSLYSNWHDSSYQLHVNFNYCSTGSNARYNGCTVRGVITKTT